MDNAKITIVIADKPITKRPELSIVRISEEPPAQARLRVLLEVLMDDEPL